MQIPLSDLIHLLHTAPHAVLSTQSTQHPGFPFGTVVPLIVDENHQPILLISALAEHTKNLLADPHASLTLLAPGTSNVQDAARATLLGKISQFTPNASLVKRYLRYLPAAEQYLQLDFSFFRMDIQQSRYIGGTGRMGWLKKTDWQDAFSIAPDAEQELIALVSAKLPTGIRVLGIDAYGVDHEINGIRGRYQFDIPNETTDFSSAQPDWPDNGSQTDANSAVDDPI